MSGACEACGWGAAFCSMLAFGSFGVPIKSDAALKVDIDPLVFQSYKSFMCFITAWLVLLTGEELRFTPWGIVSALFWVPGGCATIYAVKAAGIAVGIGVGSSFIVLVSFIWGIFIFDEHVHSRFGASFAIFCMMLGLTGMAYFSSPELAKQEQETDSSLALEEEDDGVSLHAPVPPRRAFQRFPGYRGIDGFADDEEDVDRIDEKFNVTEKQNENSTESSPPHDHASDGELSFSSATDGDAVPLTENVIVCGIKITKRQLGILAAIFCGVYGGSIMAPMKWAPNDAKGVGYLISFGVGAMLITTMLWVFRYIYYVKYYESPRVAYESLPSFHIRQMWLPGGTAGLLWSIGNFFSLISVYYLGEGVGYPLVQTSILVAGLWGIFYFKEVTGTERIAKWIASSLLTIFGILLLSYEHHEK